MYENGLANGISSQPAPLSISAMTAGLATHENSDYNIPGAKRPYNLLLSSHQSLLGVGGQSSHPHFFDYASQHSHPYSSNIPPPRVEDNVDSASRLVSNKIYGHRFNIL